MRWSEHQQALLREMGLRLWLPDSGLASGPAGASPSLSEPLPVAPPAVALPTPVPAAVPRTSAGPAPMAGPGVVPLALPGHVATLDWAALRSAVEACQACALGASRRQTVFGVGHLNAHCLIVGEAPGEQEDQQGEPFVGAAGQLLDRMLAAIGLSRGPGTPAQQVFITNTLKCRPPRNRNPAPDELAECQPFLLRQVDLVQPKVIVAMGRFAVQSLLGTDEPIGRLRGRVHRWQGRDLVVTYHPAYLLRQPADKAKAWEDLCLVADCLESAGA